MSKNLSPPEPTGSSLGRILGLLALAVGVPSLGWGLASLIQGDKLDGVDGVVLGVLATAAGCVILHRRGKDNKQIEPIDRQSAPAGPPLG